MQVSLQAPAGPSVQSFCEDSTVQPKVQQSALPWRACLCYLGTASTPERHERKVRAPHAASCYLRYYTCPSVLSKPLSAPGPSQRWQKGQLRPQRYCQFPKALIPCLNTELSSAGALCPSQTFFLGHQELIKINKAVSWNIVRGSKYCVGTRNAELQKVSQHP